MTVRWFVWLDDGVWVSTRLGDTTWEHAVRDPRVSVLIDRGRDWTELDGVRVEGVAEGFPAEHPDLRAPMSAWHEKYRQMFARDGFEAFTRDVPSLGFLRVAPSRIERLGPPRLSHVARPHCPGRSRRGSVARARSDALR